jgi:hypothetical protein
VAPGPTALASLDGVVYSASGYPAATVDVLARDLRITDPLHRAALGGSDLQGIAVHGGAVFVANSGVGTVAILSLDGHVLDEVAMPDQQAGPNPRSLAFVGDAAYVALGGSSDASGQAVAVLDLSPLAACLADAAPPACGPAGACAVDRRCVDGACRLPCGRFNRTIDLKVPGAFTAPGAPFPSRALAVGSKVYVTLGNLMYADFGGGFARRHDDFFDLFFLDRRHAHDHIVRVGQNLDAIRHAQIFDGNLHVHLVQLGHIHADGVNQVAGQTFDLDGVERLDEHAFAALNGRRFADERDLHFQLDALGHRDGEKVNVIEAAFDGFALDVAGQGHVRLGRAFHVQLDEAALPGVRQHAAQSFRLHLERLRLD